MVNVFHINSNYLTSRLHENLIEKLENKGFNNTVYMPVKKEMIDEFLYESKFDVQSPVTFKDRDKFIFTWKQHKIIKKMEERYDFKNIDIIHAHTLFTDGNAARYLSKKYNIPYVVTIRGMTDIDGFFKKRVNLRARGRKIMNEASRLIFLSEANKETLFSEYVKHNRKFLEKKAKVIPNGIDDFWFEHEYSPKELTFDKSVDLLYVGKLKASKNALSVVKAMRILKKKYQISARATFIGKIVDQDIYDELVAVEDEEIRILPPADKNKLLDLYRNSDIFIMPSFSETFGLVYPEAMSQGLPVIYSKGQGFDGQFAYGKVGFPVDPYKPEDIAEKLVEIIKNYEMISKYTINEYKVFNWQTISDKLITIYEKVK